GGAEVREGGGRRRRRRRAVEDARGRILARESQRRHRLVGGKEPRGPGLLQPALVVGGGSLLVAHERELVAAVIRGGNFFSRIDVPQLVVRAPRGSPRIAAILRIHVGGGCVYGGRPVRDLHRLGHVLNHVAALRRRSVELPLNAALERASISSAHRLFGRDRLH